MAFVDNTVFKQDNWAYDIPQKVISRGEIWDEDVIKQSLSLIISTMFGERVFMSVFGTSVWATLFESGNSVTGEYLLDEVAKAIKKWEDRVTVIEPEMRANLNYDENSVILTIPYVINQNAKTSVWQKKIYV